MQIKGGYMIKRKEILKSQVHDWLEGLIEDGELEVNNRGEIEYTQVWINKQLFEDWCLECGYGTIELMYILECFENYRAEKEIEIEGKVIYEKYDPIFDEIYREYEAETMEIIMVTMKKVA